MEVHFILYTLIAALMTLVIITFLCFIVALRCKKRKNRNPTWIRSVSIEHLRFVPRSIEEQRIRALASSPPIYSNQFVYDCYREQDSEADLDEQIIRTSTPISPPPMYANIFPPEFYGEQNYRVGTVLEDSSEIVVNPLERESNRPRYTLRTFIQETPEPKFVYWETCL